MMEADKEQSNSEVEQDLWLSRSAWHLQCSFSSSGHKTNSKAFFFFNIVFFFNCCLRKVLACRKLTVLPCSIPKSETV